VLNVPSGHALTRSKTLAPAAASTALAQTPAPDTIETHVWFPDSPTREFVVGKHIAAVVGVRNTGDEGFNTTVIQANLALVSDPSGNVMNFTGNSLEMPELQKDEEVTFQYFMPLHHSLPTRSFYLNINLYSQGATEDVYFVKQAFNSTIDLIEEPTWIDLQLLGLYAVLAGILGLGAWGLRDFAVERGLLGGSQTSTTKKSAKSKTSATKKTSPKKAASGQNEWLAGTIADKVKK